MIFTDDYSAQRVTAGLPELMPEQRARQSYVERQRFKSNVLVADATEKQAELTAPDGERPTTIAEAQLGRPMTSAEIIKRLKKLNGNLLFERSNADPSMMGIYYPDSSVTGGRRFLLGFEFGYSPEFTINGKDATGRYKETRGWRQVVARLARIGYITLASAEVAFDIPAGPQSKNWHTLTT
jgi:hypothetical protein